MAQLLLMLVALAASLSTSASVLPELASVEELVPLVLLAEDDGDGSGDATLCHNVSPASVLNCANATSTCVTEITPNWKCKLKTTGGCKCE